MTLVSKKWKHPHLCEFSEVICSSKHSYSTWAPSKAFLPHNCGNDIEINGNVADYPKGSWNIVYGEVVIDPQKYSQAIYNWTLEPIKRDLYSGNMFIGIVSDWKEKADNIYYRTRKGVAAYGYHFGGNVFESGTKIATDVAYNLGDRITVKVETGLKSITWSSNGKVATTQEIDTSKQYKLAIQLSMTTIKLHEFRCILDVGVLVTGFVKNVCIDDETKDYCDILNLIAKYCSFFD